MQEILSAMPYFPENSLTAILDDIKNCLKSGRLTDGPYLKEFEHSFAEFNHTTHAIGVNSGTASLEVALRHYNVKNREVIAPTNTFISTPNAVIFAGGKPILADMDAETLCINPEDVKKKITSKTAGIIVVHIAGLICPQINELKKMCNDEGLFLLEDASHAHGAMIDDKMAGTIGDVGCFSLYPTKVMTSCEGGMIITNNTDLAENAQCMRNCGQTKQKEVVMLGHNWRLSEIAAIVGKHQLENLPNFINKRNEIARYYEKKLKDNDYLTFLKKPQNFRHSYYKFPVKISDKIDREKLSSKLKTEYGIETGSVYYPPCHLQPYYLERITQKGNFPIAESVLKKILCLPIHAGLTNENLEYITKALVACINELS